MLAALALAIVAAVGTRSVDWLVLPIASYNSDDGLAGGAVLQVHWLGRVDPYRAAVGAQALFSTAGVQSHYLRLDIPRLFGSPLRLWLSAEYHRELFAPYYGLGNDTSSKLADHPDLFGNHAFAYRRRYPQASLAFSLPVGTTQGLGLALFSRFIRMRIETFAGSLLEQDRPTGSEGGDELAFGGSVFLDRRKGEAVASRGYLIEAAARGAGRGLGSDQSFLGLTAKALGFVPVGGRIVLAARVMGDALSSDAPLFELGRFGGADSIDGVGGERSVRGIPKNRYIGRMKTMATAEIRVRVADPRLLERRVSVGMVGFVDTGRVWQLRGEDGPFFRFHSGSGGGLRIWHREFVVRLDVGTSQERAVNVYLTFGNFF